MLSTTEGDDKPGKYPKAFRTSQVVVISKLDLLPHVNFDPERCAAAARRAKPGLAVLALSGRTGEGLDDWLAWVEGTD